MSERSEFQAIRSRLFPRLQRPTKGTAGVFVPGRLEVGLILLDGERTEVTPEDLAHWGVTFEQAYDIAYANLVARSSRNRLQHVDTVPGMSLYLPGDGDAASRALLVAELVDVPAEGLLFAVPTHDQLVVVRLANGEALEAIRVLVNVAHMAAASTSGSLTDQLFWYDGERIIHVPVVHTDDNVDVVPPPGLLAAVERLVGASLMASVAEA